MEMTPPPVRTIEIALVTKDGIAAALTAAPRHGLLDVSGAPNRGPGATVAFAATAGAFHAFFEVEAEPPLALSAADLGPVYEDDCVELFVATTEDPAAYTEIVVSAAGARYGAEVRNPDGSRDSWTLRAGILPPGLSISVSGEPVTSAPSEWRRWQATISVPWRSLSPGGQVPRPGEQRRLNAYR
ncbi:MAG: hypothetical protein ACHQPI_10880, partial [Thermoanaerobaculia bacterium]